MEILIMLICDANGNYIHPSMLRVGMYKCQASKLSEHSPSNVAFFIHMFHEDIFILVI